MESEDISAIKEFVQSVEDSLLFITMMVIAEGWGVVRCHIKHYRWTSLLCKCKYSGTAIGQFIYLPNEVLPYAAAEFLGCNSSCTLREMDFGTDSDSNPISVVGSLDWNLNLTLLCAV